MLKDLLCTLVKGKNKILPKKQDSDIVRLERGTVEIDDSVSETKLAALRTTD